MTTKLKPGDRVRIRNNLAKAPAAQTVFTITAVDVVGAGMPAHPSTYLVRMQPVSGGVEQVYGEAALVRAE